MLGLNYGVSVSDLRAAAKAAGKVYLSKKVSVDIESAYALYIENGMSLEDCQLYADGQLTRHEKGRVGDEMVIVITENVTADIESAEDIVIKCDMRNN